MIQATSAPGLCREPTMRGSQTFPPEETGLMRMWLITAGVLGLTLAAVTGVALADKNEDTIKKVMKIAMKGGLTKKVMSGKADEKQKQELVTLFKELAAVSPPKGDPSSWKAKTGALVTAAEAAAEDKPGAVPQLKNASNCKACHDSHKGK